MFKVTGVSRFKGQVKVRFANDMTRIKMLIKAGNDDIELIELPEATDKAGCVRALQQSALYKVPSFAAAIDEAAEKYLAAPRVKRAKAAPSVVKSKEPSLDAIRSRMAKVAQPTVVDATTTEQPIPSTVA
ncbi:hypothetical protein UFOVP116_143 [uncultured Caudovirales phage]|uniref:Uncharacterized protein n=1 Tax=uncultured Caudovirales phage TaxID=2100421 RepID=A0A6J5L9W7_9CAUD|nr:hypothetical protein UFOVP116_143 [uncultured Caudovirales phage]